MLKKILFIICFVVVIHGLGERPAGAISINFTTDPDPLSVSVGDTFQIDFTANREWRDKWTKISFTLPANHANFQLQSYNLTPTSQGTYRENRWSTLLFADFTSLDPNNNPDIYLTGSLTFKATHPTSLTPIYIRYLAEQYDGHDRVRYENKAASTQLTVAEVVPPPTIPEPSTWLLMSVGLGALIWVGRRRKKKVVANT